MINIDSRLLNDLDANELFLLLNLTNRINEQRYCFPGNKLLCKELGWSKEKLQQVKKRLAAKRFIEIEPRHKENSPGQTSNIYRILTPQVGNYTPGGKNGTGEVGKPVSPPVGNSDSPPVGFSGGTPVGKPGNEVLTNEELETEELTHEELEKERKRELTWISMDKGRIFKDLIETFWEHLEDHSDYYTAKFTFPERFGDWTDLDATTGNLLSKIAGAAEKIYNAFAALKRPKLLPGQNGKLSRADKPSDDVFRESNWQVNAYADYCRLSKRFVVTSPENLPEKLIEQDWCFTLLDYVKDDIAREKYDPAMDEELLSEWLIYMYYWDTHEAYECRRYNNRIVYNGEEYLKSKKG